jgi:outer membrane protein TolC
MRSLKEKITSGKWIVLIAGIVFPMFAGAQTGRHYTLNELIHSAYLRYPYAKRLALIDQQSQESQRNINTQWLPHTSVTVKNSYQSEVSSIDIPKDIEDKFGINIEGGKKLQYQGGLSVSQLVYDGGAGHIKKRISGLDEDMAAHQVRSSMLQIEGMIDDLFEDILITKEQIKAVHFKKADLEQRKKDLSAAVREGISLKTDIQEIDANIIQLDQQETELCMSLNQKYTTLSSYTREQVDSTDLLDLPEGMDITGRDYSTRPDFEMFNLQSQSAKWKLKELNAEMLPRLSLFANGYYGRPGLNMMDYTRHCSGIVGVSLTWNIDAFYNKAHQRNLININDEMTRNQRSIYEIDMNRKIDNLNTDWLKNRKLEDSDGEIIKIRSHIKEVAAVQLKSGSITLTDYLIKLNDEAQAIINKSIHHIEYLMDGAKIRTLLNRNNQEM